MCKDVWMRTAALLGVLLVTLPGLSGSARAEDGVPGAANAATEQAAAEQAAAEQAAAAEKTAAAEREAQEAVRRYARERLKQMARDTVDPGRRETGGVDALKEDLIKKRVLLSQLNPEDWVTLESLLGALDEEKRSEDGLIRQGAIFYRWMNGTGEVPSLTFQAPSTIGIDIPVETDGSDDAAEGGSAETRPALQTVTSLPVDSRYVNQQILVNWILKQDRDPNWPGQVVAVGIDKLRGVKDPLAELALSRPDELSLRYSRHFVDTRQRQVGPREQELRGDLPSPGLVSAGAVRTREERAQKIREHVNRLIAMRKGVEGALDRLATVERDLRRESGGLGFEIEEIHGRVEEARKQKAAEEEARKQEEEAARKKEEEAAAAAAKAAAEERGEVEGDGTPGKEAPAEGPPPGDHEAEERGPGVSEEEADPVAALDPLTRRLEELRLREIVQAQKLRLLYITVRRADLRYQLLGEVLNQVKAEAAAADDTLQKFEIALATMRRERQMDRLAFEKSNLKLEHERAQKLALEGPEAERPTWAAYDRALVDVNSTTIAGVEMRRNLEARTKPEDDLELEGCLPGEDPPLDEAEIDAGATSEVDPLSRFRGCRAASLDVIYVEDALSMLDEPGWDSILTARHYEAVDDRINDLESALQIIGQATALEERFQGALSTAQAALQEVAQLGRTARNSGRWRERLREAQAEWLRPNESAFQETMRGVKDEFVHVQEDLVTYRSFRERLLHLGTRSFRVRIKRQLDTEGLATAYSDSTSSLMRIGRWITFQGESHLGTYVQAHWRMLLACLGVLLGSFVFVKYGRRALDFAIHRMAAPVEVLQTGAVAVSAEQDQARVDKLLAEEAARAEEEAALREVSKEVAGKAQKMGEGGYSG
jgi:hypothetical protein